MTADKKRVLAVDDESDVLLILRTALQDTYEVVTASNGADALAAIDEQQIDLVLLDLMMPGIDGMEVLRRIRANDSVGHMPVIFLTGVSERAKMREALDLGTTYYLTKPFSVEDLLGKVDLALRA